MSRMCDDLGTDGGDVGLWWVVFCTLLELTTLSTCTPELIVPDDKVFVPVPD